MKSKTSFCNPTLLKKNIRRFPVIWVLFTILLFLCCTMPIFNLVPMLVEDAEEEGAQVFRAVWMTASVPVSAIYAVICAAACFGYLHKTRSAYMLHAFPMTRTCQFTTNYISGLLFAIVPEVFITLLNLLAAAIVGVNIFVPILQLLVLGVLEYLFFYGLAVFCMNITGKTSYGVLGYCVLNFALVVLESILRIIFEPMLYGIVSFSSENVTTPFCPVIGLYKFTLWNAIDGLPGLGWTYVFIVAAVGIALAVFAWLLYRKRHMEQAGEVVAFGWARPIFKYFFTTCAALTLGIVILGLFTVGSSDLTAGNIILSLLIAGLIGFVLAEMMLKRTVRVFKRKAFIGFAVFAAAVIAFTLCARYDVLGIVRRVPQPGQVAFVEVTSEYGATTIRLDQTKDIETVTSLQKAHIDDYMRNGNDDGWPYSDVELTYKLKDGSSFTRSYQMTDEEALRKTLNQPEVIKAYYDSFDLANQKGGDVNYHYVNFGYLSQAQLRELAAYLEEDIAEGIPDFYERAFFGNEYENITVVIPKVGTLYITPGEAHAREYLLSLLDIPEDEAEIEEYYYYD